MLIGSYDGALVVFSLLVAILASYTALDMAARVATARGRAAYLWLAGGACAMGFGIWSMHFVGMLAFSLPIPLGYDLEITFASLVIAIASSAFALWLVCQKELPVLRLGGGAVIMGMGIAAMHYSGMAAMRMAPGIDYEPRWFALSVVIAVLASGAALWIAFQLRRDIAHVRLLRVGAAMVMGCAIVGMHYTGMAAARFPMNSICLAAGGGLDTDWLALLVIIVTLSVLSLTLVVSVLDRRMELRTALLAHSLAEANRELIHLALHDNLTKLPNRVLLEDRLEQAIKKAQRYGGYFAVMFMDLDGFKAVNDAFGHQAGDELLSLIAARVREAVRAQDTVARLGGDEFVLLVEVSVPQDAAVIAEKLVHVVGQGVTVAGSELRISASLGISIYPSDGDTPRGLLANADAAMYHAKSVGRNGYCFFETSMNADAHEQLVLLNDLRLARENGELVLHYQPIFDAPRGPVIGAEALLRWQHPVRGLIPPDRFIPLAEKTGLIVPIGEWVLDEACRQMRIWRDAGHADWTMAVNLSSLQFGSAGLIQTVRDTLARHGLPPQSLTLEVTESTAMRDADASMVILRELADMGVNISIDDFGTGYSSLLYLKRLPVNELKIDRGFVRDLSRGTADAAIVSAVIALGRTLNMKVVAEGVETPAQQEFLTDLGCDYLQGFLLGRPLPADRFMALVDSGAAPHRDELPPVPA